MNVCCSPWVTVWWGAVLCLACVTAQAQVPRLLVIPDRTQLELGEPLRVTLRAEESAGDLYALSLSPLEADFRARWEQRSRSERGGDRVWSRQEMVLRLYPRRAGTLELPVLRLPDAASEATAIRVHPPDSLGFEAHAGVDTSTPYVREPVLMWLEIDTDHNQFEAKMPEIDSAEAHIQALGRQRTRTPAGRYRWRYHWLVTPLYPGAVELPLPWIEIHDFRRQGMALRMPAPTVSLAVREAPSFLPVAIPLAPVTVTDRLTPASLKKGQPALWTLELRGRDLSPRHLRRQLDRVLADSPALRFHNPTIHRGNPRDLPPGESRLQVEIPVTPRRAGELLLPGLQLSYFDTAAGRLAAATLPPRVLIVRNPLRDGLLQAIRWLGIFVLFMLIAFSLTTWLRHLRARGALRRRLTRAASPADLARALLAVDGSPPTLRQWLAMQHADRRLGDAVRRVERARYARATPDTAALRAELMAALRGHRLRLPVLWRLQQFTGLVRGRR